MNIQRWITHCDTIGDIFKNPLLIKFVSEWHQIKKEGSKIRLRVRENGEVKFTPEYYEFIREIFEDRTNMEWFLDYIREICLTSDTLYQQLQEYWPDNLVKALLSFDELNDQLAGVAWLTIAWVFKTRIADIIRDAYTQATHMEEDEEGEDFYETPWLYYALEKTLEEWIMPITSDGELIVKIWDGNVWHIVTGIWGNGEIFEVDRLWNRTDPWSKEITIRGEKVLDTREKVISRIKILEQSIEYHYSDDVVIPEEIGSFYAWLQEGFESSYVNPKDIPVWDLWEIHFWKYLIEMKNDLIQKLRNDMKISDTTQIDTWKEQWHKAGISTELPEHTDSGIPQVRGTKLEIIK